MLNFQAVYIPIGVPTFHLESAQKEFEASIDLLKKINPQVVCPDEMLLSLDLLTVYLDGVNPDLIILQNVTFANGAFASEILKRFSSPILLWTLREPVIDGGRLRLNSLTGAYSAANAIKAFRKEAFSYIFGSPTESKVEKKVKAVVKAARIKFELKNLKLSAIGHTPQGFGFGRAMDGELLGKFGVTLESIEARELIDIAKSYTKEECEAYLNDAESKMIGLCQTPEKNRYDFARLYKSYEEYVKNNRIGALASRCWPDFFTAFGTPVCAVLALLNDMGVAASCEADVYGALSLYIAMKLTEKPAFFGDPVSMDEEEGTITYWHCGTAACSLARSADGAKVSVHCNRKIGPTLDFGCEACDNVTIFRIGRTPEGSFRFFLASGEALDKPKQFSGTSIVVKTVNPPQDIVNRSVLEGFEPHFAVAYGDIADELEALAHMLSMEVCKY